MTTLGIKSGFAPFLVNTTLGVMMIIGRLQPNPALRFQKQSKQNVGG